MATRRTILTRIAVVLAIAALIAAFRTLPVGDLLISIETWVRANPVSGALTYLLLAVLAIAAATPGWVPMMLAGLVFGFAQGYVLAMLATVVGATAAMLAGRTLIRSWVEKRISGYPQLLALDDALAEQSFPIIVLTRLAYVIPFNLLNYAYGLTRVNVSGYAAATAVGMLPVVALNVYIGTVARDIGQILAGEAESGIEIWWILGFAVIALATVGLLVQRTVKKTLERHMTSKTEAARDAPDES